MIDTCVEPSDGNVSLSAVARSSEAVLARRFLPTATVVRKSRVCSSDALRVLGISGFAPKFARRVPAYVNESTPRSLSIPLDPSLPLSPTLFSSVLVPRATPRRFSVHLSNCPRRRCRVFEAQRVTSGGTVLARRLLYSKVSSNLDTLDSEHDSLPGLARGKHVIEKQSPSGSYLSPTATIHSYYNLLSSFISGPRAYSPSTFTGRLILIFFSLLPASRFSLVVRCLLGNTGSK